MIKKKSPKRPFSAFEHSNLPGLWLLQTLTMGIAEDHFGESQVLFETKPGRSFFLLRIDVHEVLAPVVSWCQLVVLPRLQIKYKRLTPWILIRKTEFSAKSPLEHQGYNQQEGRKETR